jgi:hypothetical protein
MGSIGTAGAIEHEVLRLEIAMRHVAGMHAPDRVDQLVEVDARLVL